MMLILGFGLGVLAVVLAGEYERRKRLSRPIRIILGSGYDDAFHRRHNITAQDSTLK